MKNKQESGLDFIIDKLTNSIENVVTGDSFATEISVLTKNDIQLITKTNGWVFNPDHVYLHLIESAPFNRG